MNDTLKAPIVLTLISGTVCGLLAVGNEITKDKIAQTEEKAFQQSLISAFGESSYTPLSYTYDGVNQVISDESGRLIFDVTSTGYEKDGQRLLIGLDADGSVCGISVVAIADSPTQAAKVQEESFLSQFLGLKQKVDIIDAVSGATRSSEGIHKAVSLVLDTYQAHKEELVHG